MALGHLPGHMWQLQCQPPSQPLMVVGAMDIVTDQGCSGAKDPNMVLGRSPGLTNTMYLCGKQASHISLFFMAFASSDRFLSIEHEHLSAPLTLPYPIIYLLTIVVLDYLVLHGLWHAVASSCCASSSPSACFNGTEQQVLTVLLISP